MITFSSLEIHDFRSIKHIHLTYTAGVWSVVGKNNDAFASNGAGKSSTMLALQQGLFNKNVFGIPIDAVTRHGSRGYQINVEFSDGLSGYRVENNRRAGVITVYKDGVDQQLPSIAASLKYIQLVLRMPFAVFTALTYVDSESISDILSNFSDSVFMKVILNFGALDEMAKTARARLRTVSASQDSAERELATIHTTLGVLQKFTKIDTADLNRQLLQAVGEQATGEFFSYHQVLIAEKRDERTKAAESLQRYSERLDTTVCPTCGAETPLSEAERADIEHWVKRLRLEVDSLDSFIQTQQQAQDAERQEYEDTQRTLNARIDFLKAQITTANVKNETYQQHFEDAQKLDSQEAELQQQLTALRLEAKILTETLATLRSGGVHKELLTSFTQLLNKYAQHFLTLTSLSYATIQVRLKKSSIDFVVIDARSESLVPVASLSGGEKTRLRFVVLWAMLFTIRALTNISTNLLFLDEIFDTLDASAEDDLYKMFTYMVTEDNKSIHLISHKEQNFNFTGRIVLEKTNNITELLDG